MKKLLLVSGVTWIVTLFTGSLLKVSHQNYSDQIILAGAFLGAIFFILLLFWLFWSEQQKKALTIIAVVILGTIHQSCQNNDVISEKTDLEFVVAKYHLKVIPAGDNLRQIAPSKSFSTPKELEAYLKSLRLPHNPFKGVAQVTIEGKEDEQSSKKLRVAGPCHPMGWLYYSTAILEGGSRDIAVNFNFNTNPGYSSTHNVNVTNIQVNQ